MFTRIFNLNDVVESKTMICDAKSEIHINNVCRCAHGERYIDDLDSYLLLALSISKLEEPDSEFPQFVIFSMDSKKAKWVYMQLGTIFEVQCSDEDMSNPIYNSTMFMFLMEFETKKTQPHTEILTCNDFDTRSEKYLSFKKEIYKHCFIRARNSNCFQFPRSIPCSCQFFSIDINDTFPCKS